MHKVVVAAAVCWLKKTLPALLAVSLARLWDYPPPQRQTEERQLTNVISSTRPTTTITTSARRRKANEWAWWVCRVNCKQQQNYPKHWTDTHWTAAKQKRKRENRQADYQKHRLSLVFSIYYFARPTFTPHAPSDTELFGILGGYNWHRPLFSSSSLLSVTKTEPFSLVWFNSPLFLQSQIPAPPPPPLLLLVTCIYANYYVIQQVRARESGGNLLNRRIRLLWSEFFFGYHRLDYRFRLEKNDSLF